MKKSHSLTAWRLFFAFLFCITAFEADTIGQSINEPLVTKQAKQDHPFWPKIFSFSISDTQYLVFSNGSCVKTDFRGKSRNFVLSLNKDFYIEKINYLDKEGDIIIIYGVSDSDGAAGNVICIDSKTLKRKWLAYIPGFNVGDAIAKDHWLYLTAIGFVGKLDLKTGRYSWKYENLYNKKPGIFNSFEKPVIEKNLVKFTEILPLSERSPVTIVINDHTGKIINPLF